MVNALVKKTPNKYKNADY